MTLLVDVSGVSSRVSCGTNTVDVTISIARATRSMRGLAPAPDALASVAAKKFYHPPLTSAFTPSRRARVRGWRRSSTKTVTRRALSARAATSVVARAWEPSVGGAPGSPPGASRVTVSGVARSRCVREGRENGSDTCRAVTRGTLTWMARKAFERDLRDTTAGRSSVGLDRRVGGERRRAHAPDLVFVGFFDLFVRRVRLELGVGHVACRS